MQELEKGMEALLEQSGSSTAAGLQSCWSSTEWQHLSLLVLMLVLIHSLAMQELEKGMEALLEQLESWTAAGRPFLLMQLNELSLC